MFKRVICAFLVALLTSSLFWVAYRCDDPQYAPIVNEDGEPVYENTIIEDGNTLTLWYTDDSLTEFLTTEAFLYQSDTGIKVNPVLVSGVEYLEHINSASLTDVSDRTELPPDVYIATHDMLLRAYLSGIASSVDEQGQFLNASLFPQTALNAVTCYGKYVGFPLSYETNFFLYNKTYMASIAQNKIQSESDALEGMAAQEEADNGTDNKEVAKELKLDEEEQEMLEQEFSEDGEPMGEEDEEVSEEVLEKLSTMIPATIDDITTFANNYDAPEAVESVFEWDVTDIFYNYFFVGNYMDVGGYAGDDTTVFNIYNQQAVECLSVYQKMNQFFSIDADSVTYDSILKDFVDGKTVFTVATTDAIAKIEKAKEEGKFPYEYGVTVLPDISSLLKARGLSMTTAVTVNGYSEKTEVAEDFARFLTVDKSQDLYKKSGKIACKLDNEYDNAEITNVFKEYEKSVPLPKMVEAINYWVQLEIVFTKIWNGADPDTTLKELSDTIGGQIEEIKLTIPTQESFAAGGASMMR